MDNIEEYVRSKLERRYDVLVAIITDTTQLVDSERAKMLFRRYQLEILSCKHPTQCRDTSGRYTRFFIFGATSYMKEDEEYLEKFLNACNDSNLTEIIGIRAS